MEKTSKEIQADIAAKAKERRAQVLAMRAEGKTLADIAAIMGISPQRASQIEKQAKKELANVSRGTGEKG